MKKVLFFLFFTACSTGVFAQPSSFSTDSVKFLKQAIDFIGDQDKSTAKEFKEKFEPVWLGQYTYSQRVHAVKIANGMLARGTQAFPEFYDFLQSLYGFKVTNQPESSFNAWAGMVEKLVASKDRKQLPEFLKMSAGLFTKGVVYETAAMKWKCRSKNYKFDYDKQPKIIFESLDLICYAKNDSMVIYNTSGIYSPISTSWEGKGGKITWERARLDNSPKYDNFDSTHTYAKLKRYKALFKTPGLDADSVLFYTPYFKKPLAGELTEKVGSTNAATGVRYPQFSSYSKRLFIKDFYEGIDYEGGFTMQGGNVVGSGTTQQMAKLIFYREKKKFLVVGATSLVLNNESVSTDRGFVTFYIDQDSIYHPGINFNYTQRNKQVSMVRSGNGIVMSPFYDSYHQLEMAPEAVYWKTDEPVIEFKPASGSSKTDGQFSSFNYFINELYDNIRGMGNRNPLHDIAEMTIRKDTMVIAASDIATFMGFTTEELIPLFYELTTIGLLYYDNESGMVTVKPKLRSFSDARAKKKDYDPIIFESDLKGVDASQNLRELKKIKAEINYNIADYKKRGLDTTKLAQEKAELVAEENRIINSVASRNTSNATLNLSNLDLLIRGVKRVTLSDSQIVRVYPFNQEFVVKKNRDFVFSGVINAGSTEFFGNNFSYEYAEHKLNLPQADSMRLRVYPFGTKGQIAQVRVSSVIRNVRGSILIDQKENKAGNKKGNMAYPLLDCVKECYVYYNKKSIYRGVYDSSKFFFKIAPFKMDSLDNFKIQGVNFAGDFYSAGILPPIKEALKVQKDYSLGFIRKAPPEGFSLYGNKAKFNNDIRLSDKGLQADGELNYLSSYASSKNFVLFPDSISGVAEKYENREQMAAKAGELNVPHVVGKDVQVTFVPKDKVFYARTIEASMKTYNDQSDFRGKMILRPEGLTARGRFIFGKADLKGKVMKCKSRTIDSDTADFKIKSIEDPNQIAIGGPNLNAHIDFDKRFGEFKKNNAADYLTLGEIKYICYMDRFKWFMDNEDIQLESDKKKQGGADVTIDTDIDLAGSNFFSIHPDQDSLNFMAPKARFDLKKKIVYCEKVEYVTVADARITPDSNKVIIRKNAEMDELRNAKIVANYITKYHSIYNAKVKVIAKRKYKASGDYTYIDENNYEQKIHFDNIAPDSTFQTYAKGDVPESQKFALSPNFEYKGGVVLKAADIGLNFDGYTRIAHNCKNVARNWFKFKAVVDPKDIYIPIEENLTSDNKKLLGSGVYMNVDSSSTAMNYSAFLSEKWNAKDPTLMSAKGFLVFDKPSQEYRIASLDKLKNPLDLAGDYISLKKDACNMFADGRFSFISTPSVVKVNSVGTMNVKAESEMTLSMMFDFPMNDNVMEKWAEKVITNEEAATIEDIDKTPYVKMLRMVVGDNIAEMVRTDVQKGEGIPRKANEVKKSLVLADVKFKWNSMDGRYVSHGKIGIAHVYGKAVFKYVDGVITITKLRNEDVIDVYLQAAEGDYMYFTLKVPKNKDSSADVWFSDSGLTGTIQEMKEDKTKTKGGKDEKDYSFRANKGKVAFLQGLMQN